MFYNEDECSVSAKHARISRSMLSPYLNVAAMCGSSRSLGPGERGAVWVQGCPFQCKGCIAPDWLPLREANLVTPVELADQLLKSQTVTGLTFSGGEPMLQAAGLAEVAQIARARRELNIICFTGFRYEHLLEAPPSPGVFALLEHIDVLIDGAYVESKDDGLGLRGSNNQRIIHLTSRLAGYNLETWPRRVEIEIRHMEAMVVGIPSPKLHVALIHALEIASSYHPESGL